MKTFQLSLCLTALLVGIIALLHWGVTPPPLLAGTEAALLMGVALNYGFTARLPRLPWLALRPVRGAILVSLGTIAVFVPIQLIVAAWLIGRGIRLVWLSACQLADAEPHDAVEQRYATGQHHEELEGHDAVTAFISPADDPSPAPARRLTEQTRTVSLLISAALFVLPAVACADGRATNEQAADAVVGVIRPSPGGDIHCGSGVMVMEDTVLTAAHNIRGGPVEVVFAARDHRGALITRPSFYVGRGQPCRILTVSHERDLALLRLVEPVEDVDVLRLATASAVPGDPVFSISAGSAAALWHHVSGHVRQRYKGSFRAEGGVKVRGHVLETAIALNPRDAGSPLLNQQAMLVGLNLASHPTNRQVSKAVDLSEVKRFLAEALPAEWPERLKSKAHPKPAVSVGSPCDVALSAQPGRAASRLA